jgi:alkylation response protein AidB-like acyl-CoA dehydrogenase
MSLDQERKIVALTQLSEDEGMFLSTVRKFAVEQIAPLVHRMDEEQHMDAGLVRRLFELGLMGVSVPEQYGGSGGSFFDSVLAVEAVSEVDPAVGVMVDVQNTLACAALTRWGTGSRSRNIWNGWLRIRLARMR